MSAVMPKAMNPTLMSGNAQPQAIAAVRAKTTTHTGRWNTDIFVCSTLFFLFFQCFSTLSYTKLSHQVGANGIVLKLVLYLCTVLHAAGYSGEDSNCYYRNGHYLLQRYKNYSYQLAKWDKYFHLVSSFYQYSLRNSAISLGFD
jgi:hypothetical protein